MVAAGFRHTVLLRSDGRAVACGWNADGQCDLPALQSWRAWFTGRRARRTYVASPNLVYAPVLLILQASRHETSILFTTLAGDVRHQFEATDADRLEDVRTRLTTEACMEHSRVDVISPSGALMSNILREFPLATLGAFMHTEVQ